MGEKRRRETGIPRIVCKAADRRFDRLLKEDSLEELLTNIRQKLRLAPDSSLKLVRVAADGQSVDLEDEDDFDALYNLAHTTATPVEINITADDVAETTSTPAERSKNGEPPKKRQRVSKPKQVSNSTPSAQPLQTKAKAGKKAAAPPEDDTSPTAAVRSSPDPGSSKAQDPPPAGAIDKSAKSNDLSDAIGARPEAADSEDEPLASPKVTRAPGPSKVTTVKQSAVLEKTITTKQAAKTTLKDSEPAVASDEEESPVEHRESPHPPTVSSGPITAKRRGRKSTSDKPFKMIKTKAKPQTPEQLLKKMANLKKLGIKLLKRQEALAAKRDRSTQSQAVQSTTEAGALPVNGTTPNPQSPSRDVPTSSMPIDVTQGNEVPSPAGKTPDDSLLDEGAVPVAVVEVPPVLEEDDHNAAVTATAPETTRLQLPSELDSQVPVPAVVAEEHAPIIQSRGSLVNFRRLAESSSEDEDDSDDEQRRRPRLNAPPAILTASAIIRKSSTAPAPNSVGSSPSSARRLSEASVTKALLEPTQSEHASPQQTPSPREEANDDPIESEHEEENAADQQPAVPSSPISQFPPSTPRKRSGVVANMKDRTGISPTKRSSQEAKGSSQADMPPPSSMPTKQPSQDRQEHDSHNVSLAQWSTLDSAVPSSPSPSSYLDELHSEGHADIDMSSQNPLFLNSETQLVYPYSQYDNVLKAAATAPKEDGESSDDSESDAEKDDGAPSREASLVPARLAHQNRARMSLGSTPRQKSYVALSTLANSAMRAPPSFTPRPVATPARMMSSQGAKRQVDYGYEDEEQEDEESSNSEREEANAHIPKGRRAGMMGKAKR